MLTVTINGRDAVKHVPVLLEVDLVFKGVRFAFQNCSHCFHALRVLEVLIDTI